LIDARPGNAIARSLSGIAVGYVLGMIPIADLVNRAANPVGPDLRAVGSQNPGALNSGKQLGIAWGATVLAGDVAKGAAAAAVGRRFGGPTVANLASAAAVCGHCYPIGRSGGKGVATSIGQVIGTFPTYLPLDLAVAAATAALPHPRSSSTKPTMAATAVASIVWVATSTVAWRRGWSTGVDAPASAALPVGAAISSLAIARRFAQGKR